MRDTGSAFTDEAGFFLKIFSRSFDERSFEWTKEADGERVRKKMSRPDDTCHSRKDVSSRTLTSILNVFILFCQRAGVQPKMTRLPESLALRLLRWADDSRRTLSVDCCTKATGTVSTIASSPDGNNKINGRDLIAC